MTQETVDFYTNTLKEYSTNASKKAFLTRSRKEVESHIEDLKWALKRTPSMLHGEYVHPGHLMVQEHEVDFINRLYKKL
jgi:hypothetical protein|tara:strand:- start:832 stop:1068 length:237 start_codon:yes stop_codon:yes gene_type:complete